MRENGKKKQSLTTWIFAALVAGALLGIILHYWVPGGGFRDDFLINGVFYVIGNGFVRLMQMLVVPLVFCSLICGSASIGDTKTLGKVGVKTVIFYLITTAVAVMLAIGVARLVNPGLGLDLSDIETGEAQIGEMESVADTILNIIPKNPIQGLAEGNMLQIILFALLTGIILAKLGSGGTVLNFFEQFNGIMMEMTNMIMKVAPLGVFCLIAKTFSGIGFDAFVPMIKYIVAVFAALLLQCFVVYLSFLKGFTGLSPLKFIKKFIPVIGFAFSTASSNATIPMSIETLEEKMGVSTEISSFTIPLGATINMDGTAIMQGVAVVFVAQAFGIHLGMTDYLTVITTATLASIGTAGVPGVGLITLSMVFQSIGLPAEGIALIMGIDRIIDMGRTAVNVTGDAVCTTIIAEQAGDCDRDVFYAD